MAIWYPHWWLLRLKSENPERSVQWCYKREDVVDTSKVIGAIPLPNYGVQFRDQEVVNTGDLFPIDYGTIQLDVVARGVFFEDMADALYCGDWLTRKTNTI